MRHVVTSLVGCLLMAAQIPSFSAELSELAVYRDVTGKLTPSSQRSLSTLRRAAQSRGQLEFWVMFDMPFQSDPNLRTSAVVRSEAAIKAALIEQVFSSLRQDVEVLDTPNGLEEAPGCLVLATAKGLDALVSNYKVKHVSYFPISE